MLYLLYTSGTTAKPKGIMHTTAGYLVGTSYTHQMIFDLKPDDVYWCAADIGWVTGHSYIVYGPLANATTGILYEGSPDTPAWDRWWQIIEDYKVSILYCAPTAIRAFMKQGDAHPAKHDLSSLRVLGSVGEPINPEAWLWYNEHIGGGKAPIVDTWWQTETGMILITPLPGVTTTKPGSATFPFPGIQADVVDAAGESVPLGQGGYLVLKRPWPSMLRGIYGDPERYKQTYWSRFPGMYFAGDGAKRDSEGYFWLLGPGRRRDEHLRSPPLDHGDRERAGVPSGGRRGGRRRRARSDHRRGDQRVRHPPPRQRPDPGAGRRAPPARGDEDQPDREAQDPDVHARPAEDALRQDHAPAPARHRPGQQAGRHDDARRRRRRGADPREQLEDRGVGQGAAELPAEEEVGRAEGRQGRRGHRRRARTAKTPVSARSGVAFDGLTEEWRLVGRMSIDGRLLDSLNKREAIEIHDVQWAPIDGSGPFAPAPGLRSVDPYDLILVLAGADTMPDLSEEEKAAHRVHKVSYDVALEAPPFRVIGTVLMHPGAEPDRLLDRATEMFVAVTDAQAFLGDEAVARRRRDGPAQPLLPARRRADRQADRVEAPEAAGSAAWRHLMARPVLTPVD